MGYYYNSQCTTQTCSSLCCNYYGSCPSSYSSSYYSNQCWYYYSYYSGSSCSYVSSTCCYSSTYGYYTCNNGSNGNNGNNGGSCSGSINDPSYCNQELGPIIGGAVGGFVFLVLMIVLIVCMCRRYRNPVMPPTVMPKYHPTTISLTNPTQPPNMYGYHMSAFPNNPNPNFTPNPNPNPNVLIT